MPYTLKEVSLVKSLCDNFGHGKVIEIAAALCAINKIKNNTQDNLKILANLEDVHIVERRISLSKMCKAIDEIDALLTRKE